MGVESYDVVVIGAGIHGTGVAQAAAARGHSVLVLEQNAPAGGTSSRSSKLIHGGLRYLETAQFGLVRECLRERAVLLRIAPELVRLRPFYIPVYRDMRRRPWWIAAGLSLYTLLGGLSVASRFERVPHRDWSRLDGLDTHGLQAVFRYQDAQTDDAALTRAVLNSAQQLGARLALPAQFAGAELYAEGVRVRYRTPGGELECAARVLINAAGPWANELLARITPVSEPLPVELVQGTHIVLPGTLTQGMYYLEAPADHRAVFAMPWRDAVLVGTTETRYTGRPEAVQPLPQECDYLLATLAHYFPAWREPAQARIQEAFAGLRVLPARSGAAFLRPRETILRRDAATGRLLTIYGGKLTAYRATAQQVMNRLAGVLPSRSVYADTAALPLTSDTGSPGEKNPAAGGV